MAQFVGDDQALKQLRAPVQQPNLWHSADLPSFRIRGGDLGDHPHQGRSRLMPSDLQILGSHQPHGEGLRPPGQPFLPKAGLDPAKKGLSLDRIPQDLRGTGLAESLSGRTPLNEMPTALT